MFDTPFTRYHDQGVVGCLGQEMAKNVVELMRNINTNVKNRALNFEIHIS